jgi:hypothetical protein
MIVSAYNPQTGEIYHSVHVESELQATQLYTDWIAGAWPNDQYRVVNSQPVALPPKPVGNLPVRFDHAGQQWQVNDLVAANIQRRRRNSLLKSVDQVNTVRFATLTDQQRTELAQYRLDLLSVPQQDGFPSTIVWPTKPHWL